METIPVYTEYVEIEGAELVGYIEVDAGFLELVEWPIFAGDCCKIAFVPVDEIPF